MKSVLIFAAVAEAATGLALLVVPSLVGQLLLGEDLTGVAIPLRCSLNPQPTPNIVQKWQLSSIVA
jgi:hypothetical protein